jgi:tRNA threonylcarbamoyladenosine biosynthesis protein TsaE
LGRQLGELLRPGDVVLLEGEFGAGKTVLSQGIAEGLGVAEYVTSPSFTLINEYRLGKGSGEARLYHIDLYRLENPAEVVDLGLLDFAGGEGVVLVEWAERVRGLLPPEYLLVELAVAGATRRSLRFTALGERHAAVLGALAAVVSEDGHARRH